MLFNLGIEVWCCTPLYCTYTIAFGFPNHNILQDKFLLHAQENWKK